MVVAEGLRLRTGLEQAFPGAVTHVAARRVLVSMASLAMVRRPQILCHMGPSQGCPTGPLASPGWVTLEGWGEGVRGAIVDFPS